MIAIALLLKSTGNRSVFVKENIWLSISTHINIQQFYMSSCKLTFSIFYNVTIYQKNILWKRRQSLILYKKIVICLIFFILFPLSRIPLLKRTTLLRAVPFPRRGDEANWRHWRILLRKTKRGKTRSHPLGNSMRMVRYRGYL